LVVPGYVGARSVKWITAITVQSAPSSNYFQAHDYRILAPDVDPDTAAPGEGISLSSLPLNCDILVPGDDAEVPAGPLTVQGWAMAGDARRISRVDVSLDEGRSWRQADLQLATSKWAWRLWSLTVEAHPGPMILTARAWDDTGVTQPESPASLWNPRGYQNNAWAHVELTVVEPGRLPEVLPPNGERLPTRPVPGVNADTIGERGRDAVPDSEPDYRFTLANERTLLAWERTALGLLAAAVAVVQLVPELPIPGARSVLGMLLAVLATLTAGLGLRRWEQVDRAIRSGMPLPRHAMPVYLGVGLIVVGLLTLGLVISKAITG
jgi:uncharacterized membrane protein YidH (DUF202 family)